MFDYEKTTDVGVYKHLLAFIKESLILTPQENANLRERFFRQREKKINEQLNGQTKRDYQPY